MWATAACSAGYYRYYFPAVPVNYAYSYMLPSQQAGAAAVCGSSLQQQVLVHPSPYHPQLLNYPQHQQEPEEQFVPPDSAAAHHYNPHSNQVGFFPASPHDRDILDILERKKMKQEDVETRWRMLEILEELLCFGSLHFHGSFLTGLGLADSDVDVCFEDHAMRKKKVVMKLVAYAIEELENKSKLNFEIDDDFLLDEKLLGDKLWRVLQVKTQGRVPTTVLENLPSKLKVNISFDNFMSVQTSKLIHFYVTLDPIVAQLCLLFQHWAKTHDLTDSRRGLKNYAINLLVIVFLVRRNFLPSVELLQSLVEPQMLSNNQHVEDDEEERVAEWNVAFCDDLEQVREVMKVNGIGVEKIPAIGQPGILSVALELFQMMRRIGSLDCIVVTLTSEIRSLVDFAPNNEGKLPESQWRYTAQLKEEEKLNFVSRGQLYVQDPFDLGLNVTCSLDANHFKALMNALNSTIAVIEEYTSNDNLNPFPLSVFVGHVDDEGGSENLEGLKSKYQVDFEDEGEVGNEGESTQVEEYLVEAPPSPGPVLNVQYKFPEGVEDSEDNPIPQMSTVSLVTNQIAQNSQIMAYQEMQKPCGFATIPYAPVHYYPVYKPIPIQVPIPIPIPVRVPIHHSHWTNLPPRLRPLLRQQHQNQSQSKSKSKSQPSQPKPTKFPTNSPILRITRPIPDSRSFEEIFQCSWTMEQLLSFCTSLNASGQASLKLFWYEATLDFFKYYIQKSIPFATKSPVDSRIQNYGNKKDNKSEKSLKTPNHQIKLPDVCTLIFQFTLDLHKLETLKINEKENRVGAESKNGASSSLPEKGKTENSGNKIAIENGKKLIHDHRDFSAVARLIINGGEGGKESASCEKGKEFSSTLTLTVSENMKMTERRRSGNNEKGRQLLKEKLETEFPEFALNYVKERFRLSRSTARSTTTLNPPSTNRASSRPKSLSGPKSGPRGRTRPEPGSGSGSALNTKERKGEGETLLVMKNK